MKRKAFTLVELIVVITILAILGTIAFISMQGYSKSSRDSVRVSDMSKIKSSLELFQIDTGKYPETTNGVEITYSGAGLWKQGNFGEQTYKNVDRLDKIPLDPLTGKEYIYSVLNTRNEYEIGGIMETEDIAYIPTQTNAANEEFKAYVSGYYNGKIAKIVDNKITYVLAVPTIISASGITLEDIIANNEFVFSGYKNLPFQYEGYNTLGENGTLNLVDVNNYVVYSGSISDLTDPNDATARVAMLENLKAAYSGTLMANEDSIAEILAIEDFTTTDQNVVDIAGVFVNNTLGASVETGGNTGTQQEEQTPKLYTIPTDGLIAKYPLNGTANDFSGNNNHGTENGGLIYIADSTFGTVANFDGIDDYIDLSVSGVKTISFWFKSNTSDYLIDTNNPSRSYLQLDVNNSNNLYFSGINKVLVDGTEIQSGTMNYSDGNWHFLVAEFLNNNSEIVVGSRYSKDVTFLEGQIANIYSYDKVLSQDEINNLYYEGLTEEQILANIEAEKIKSCKAILDNDSSKFEQDGTYSIDPDGVGGNAAFDVYCDMTNDGGGWTRIFNDQTNNYNTPTSGIGELFISEIRASYIGVNTMGNLVTPGKSKDALLLKAWCGSVRGGCNGFSNGAFSSSWTSLYNGGHKSIIINGLGFGGYGRISQSYTCDCGVCNTYYWRQNNNCSYSYNSSNFQIYGR